jgi:hypothetical protein
MAFTCSLTKQGARKSNFASVKAKPGDVPPAGGDLEVGQNGTVTLFGVTQSGASGIDLSAVATEAVTSSDPTVASVDAPAGMTTAYHGLKVGTTTFTWVATWNDNSAGPFTISVLVTVSAKPDPVTGLTVVFGTPTVGP